MQKQFAYEPLSREFLLARKSCCGSTCTYCPYTPKHQKGATRVASKPLP